MNTLESIKRRPRWTRTALAAVYVAGITAIVGWSLPLKHPAVKHDEVATPYPEARNSDPAAEFLTPSRMPATTRSRGNCADCGVIESVRTIHRREEIAGGCAPDDADAMRIPGSLIDTELGNHVSPLADAIAQTIVGKQVTKKIRVTTRHQIVIRFRDGSKRVFDEETPRSLRVGERVQVIDGTNERNG